MQRRTFLTAAASAAAVATRKARAATRVLRYVPQTDLTVIDPVMTTAYITRYHATMVWDQLYGNRPQPLAASTADGGGSCHRR